MYETNRAGIIPASAAVKPWASYLTSLSFQIPCVSQEVRYGYFAVSGRGD